MQPKESKVFFFFLNDLHAKSVVILGMRKVMGLEENIQETHPHGGIECVIEFGCWIWLFIFVMS